MSLIKMRGSIDVLFAFKIFSLPVPTRPSTQTFWQVPDPSHPEVKNPYPSDPGVGHPLEENIVQYETAVGALACSTEVVDQSPNIRHGVLVGIKRLHLASSTLVKKKIRTIAIHEESVLRCKPGNFLYSFASSS